MGDPSDPLLRHQIRALLLTFAAYAAFHASRKPPSIVKGVLLSSSPPFHGPRGPHRLGELDLAFLSSYAVSMFLSGHLADSLPLRPLLSLAMAASGASAIAFSAAYWFPCLQTVWFFLAVQVASGAVQSVGWPCVVAVVGNWFGKSRRGLVMGVWNSHTSVGNAVGSVVAAAVLEHGWGWSFAVPGVLIALMGAVVWGFLVVRPGDVGIELEGGGKVEMGGGVGNAGEREDVDLLAGGGDGEEDEEEKEEEEEEMEPDSEGGAIGFLEAWRLPGVAQYACCLFFSKLVAYTFLYWLPLYIQNTAVAGKHLSHRTAGILSTLFDMGGILGGISAGYISDKLDARAVTSLFFLVFSIPALIFYRVFGGISRSLNTTLMFLSGYFVNGPYALITTAVSADLGTQESLKGNSRALATVTAIIDGTGSIGAALGPLLTGYISTRGWNAVFVMLILASSCATLFLIRLAKVEIAGKMSDWK